MVDSERKGPRRFSFFQSGDRASITQRRRGNVMSIDAPRQVAGVEPASSDPHLDLTPTGCNAEFEQRARNRQAAIQRILAQRKPELIEEGIEAYKRDLPRLLEENRYRQLVAYRGSTPVAFAWTHRQLKKKLTKAGFADRGELFIISIAPLQVDD